MKRSLIAIACVGALGILLPAQQASAGCLTLDLSFEFSGATAPVGQAPWVTATFCDTGTGDVELTIDTNLTGDEWLNTLYFNLDPSLDPTLLSFTFDSTNSTGPEADSISTGVDAFKADGDGFLDIEFDFPNGPSNGFTDTETVIYTISYAGAGFSAFSFNFGSVGSDKGSQYAAAHIQGIGPDGNFSGWVGTVPEPGSLTLLGMGVLGMFGAGWRARRRRAA